MSNLSNEKSETGFSHIKRAQTASRANLSEQNVSSIMRVVMDGQPYMEHDSTKAVEVFLKLKNRKRVYMMPTDKRKAMIIPPKR